MLSFDETMGLLRRIFVRCLCLLAVVGLPIAAQEVSGEMKGMKLDPPPANVGVVNVPGELSLFDVGWYRPGYRIDGRPVEWLNVGWSGEDAATGTAFDPGLVEGGRRAGFIHVPWRRGAGNFYLDYNLRLPETPGLRFDTSVALRPGAVGKSDGVTLRAYVNGQKRLELRNKSAEWTEGGVDLSGYRGMVIHLRIELDPGPARSTAYDWALIGDPRLVAVRASSGPGTPASGVGAEGQKTPSAMVIGFRFYTALMLVKQAYSLRAGFQSAERP